MQIGFDANREPRFPAAPLGFRGDASYRTVEEARIVENLLTVGWAHEMRDGQRERATREAAATLERALALGLPLEATYGKRRFDPVEVLNFLKAAGIEGTDPFWEGRFVPTNRKLVRDSNGGEERTSAPQRFEVRLAREYGLHGHEPGAPLRLRLPLPLEDATLRDLHVELQALEVSGATVSRAPGRIDACFATPAGASVTLAADMRFTATPIVAGSAAVLAPGERELYLRPREGLLRVTPRIEALAQEVAGSQTDPWASVRSFWNFELDRFRLGGLHYDKLAGPDPLGKILDAGWFDCRMGVTLLTALCRARKIPARILSGFVLYEASPFYHYWCEAWIEGRGWVPFDFTSWDLSSAGRDPAWRDYFAGYLTYRMTTETLPRSFTGTPSIRFPDRWYTMAFPIEGGTDVGFYAVDSGELIYRDRLRVRRLP